MSDETRLQSGREGGRSPDLAEAVAALACAVAAKPPAHGGSSIGKVVGKAFETVLPSAVMFFLGFIFIQGVQLDLQRQQFTASAADKLKDYVETLIAPTTEQTTQELRATALALGGFGSVAAFPLVSIIEHGGEQRIDSGKTGLEQAGRIAPTETCSVIASVIDDSTNAYKWQTRKAVSEVAGLLGCPEARMPLERSRAKIAAIEGLTSEQRVNFETEVDKALERIRAADRRNARWW